ncbi:MAG TPA: tannase/feruloyl esterase family alpha/beta hydrolase [Vicinamibacterales bacterium]|nr:tannase/feruloyl esterase family alpha/beta hydrolase [Vicinamibacterales bacterium]
MKTAIALAASLLLFAGSAHAASSCEDLSKLSIPNATITTAQSVAAGAFTAPAGRGGANPFASLPAFCRVLATLKPTPGSDITIEVWLPANNWNGKFQGVGNGVWFGNIDQNSLATALRRGYATAGTDTGHEGNGGPWMRDKEKLIDYGYRSVHEMTAAAKTIVNAFYGNAPKFSYFNSCSSGGREALKEAQMFPDDYDGIVAGSPALNTTARSAYAIHVAQVVHKDEASFIPPAKFAAIHEAALQACDALDGVTDRVITNPRACRFDPAVIACKAGEDSNSCLTAAQVATARALYQPLVNPKTKKVINPGLEPGSEPGWNVFAGPQPFGTALQFFQFMATSNPQIDYKTIDFSNDATLAAIDNDVVNAKSTDLKKFVSIGGRMIQYHGWSDPQIPPGSSVNYYEDVLKAMGPQVKDNYRLFMVPGMNHCGGGDGPASFDMLTALEQWVEQKKAPDTIPAAHLTNGQADRTRILCPHPQVATYTGSGDPNSAASFVCK